jgi:tetratricopeptide (TPR) repeat protein/predicted aspartyl protease
MLRRAPLVSLALFGLSIAPLTAFGGCKLEQIAHLAVTMDGLRPLVPAKIDGSDVQFVADSGAFFNTMSAATAAEFKLRLYDPPIHLALEGIGGYSTVQVAKVKHFTIAGIPVSGVEFLVGGSDIGGGAAGVIGQNVFRIADVEYDLANGMIRFMRPNKECRTANLVYWAHEGQGYSEMEIDWATPQQPYTIGTAFLDGVKIRVIFDTGSGPSLLGVHAAARAGIKPDSPGVVPAGALQGYGSHFVKNWIAPFKTFRIGDEEIRNIHLRFGETDLPGGDMLIGADFFLSHRVYVASSQHKLYFTYNGGPVFKLTTVPDPVSPPRTASSSSDAASPTGPAPASGPATPTAPPDPAPSSSPAASPAGAAAATAAQTKKATAEPTTAEDFARRGAALAARHDYEHAIPDLTRACELAPQESQYFFQRAEAYGNSGHPELAKADLEQALKLKPDNVRALLVRAQLRLAAGDAAAAIADLDAADRAAAQQADLRLDLGYLYARAHRLPQAIAQYGLWIAVHENDARLAAAYRFRCWARAASGQELEQGLADCNKANRLLSNNTGVLFTRGLLRLRMGDYVHAISDFDASLKRNPRNAWSLYGRGQALLRQQKTAAAESDFAAATALHPHIADEFKEQLDLESEQAH